jgi:hypothetical protein
MLKSAISKFHSGHDYLNCKCNDDCKCLLFLCSKCAKREKFNDITYDPYLRECPENMNYFDDDMNSCSYCYRFLS